MASRWARHAGVSPVLVPPYLQWARLDRTPSPSADGPLATHRASLDSTIGRGQLT